MIASLIRRLAALAGCGALILGTSACTRAELSDPAPAPRESASSTATAAPAECRFTLTPYDRETHHPSKPEDEARVATDVAKAVKYVDGFWRRHWSECFPGVTYEPPESRGLYSDNSDVTCGAEHLSADNAFYCPQGRFVAFGNVLMDQALNANNALIYMVVAHEWGHAVQDLLRGTEYQTFVAQRLELQADCLSGAALWGSDYEGYFEWQDGDTDAVVAFIQSISDESPWTKVGPNSQANHGDSLERIGSFEMGRGTSGVTNCFDMRPSEVESSSASPAPSPSPTATPSAAVEIDARDHDATGWVSPSGNIACEARVDNSDAEVRCDALEHTWTIPDDAQTCDTATPYLGVEIVSDESDYVCSDDVATTATPGSGDTWWWSPGDPTTDDGRVELPYGGSVRVSDDLTCISEKTGMTCRDDVSDRHFLVSRRHVSVH